jgi:hypothetical protein
MCFNEHHRPLHFDNLLRDWRLLRWLSHPGLGLSYTISDAREEVSQLRPCQHLCQSRLCVLCIFVAKV